MQQGPSNRAIVKSGLMGRRQARQLSLLSLRQGWLEPGTALPDCAMLAELFESPNKAAAGSARRSDQAMR